MLVSRNMRGMAYACPWHASMDSFDSDDWCVELSLKSILQPLILPNLVKTFWSPVPPSLTLYYV